MKDIDAEDQLKQIKKIKPLKFKEGFWWRGKWKLEGGILKPVSKTLDSYNVFQEYFPQTIFPSGVPSQIKSNYIPLYLKFVVLPASGGEMSDEKILRFVNSYGILGVERAKWLGNVKIGAPPWVKHRLELFEERVEDFKHEAQLFQGFLQLASAYEKADEERASQVLLSKKNVFLPLIKDRLLAEGDLAPYLELANFLSGGEKSLNQEAVGELISLLFSRGVGTIAPAFVTKAISLIPTWHFESLLSALYAMVWLEYEEGKHIVTCAREDCKGWVVVTKKNKKYCSPKCAKLQADRDYQRNRRKRLRSHQVEGKQV